MVCDRDRITGVGVTSGIEFALTVAVDLAGDALAEEIQLQMEYDPSPPFQIGSLRSAPEALVVAMRQKLAPFIARRRAATERATARLAAST